MAKPAQIPLRNIGIVAHIDAGKTTVSERILYYCGVEHRMGEVHEGTAVMDWMEEERRRGITICAAATAVRWRDVHINLIDTPGHVDFTIEVERSMRVLDGAVLVLNGVAGVQAQTETVWQQIERHKVPYLVFVNQYDRPGADYFRCIDDLRQRLGVRAIAVQYPLESEREFRSIVDLVERCLWTFPEADLGREPTRGELPAECADEVDVLRAELLEVLAEGDEELLNCLVEERDPDPSQMRAALRKRVLAGELTPVLVGAALRNVGIQPLLDAVLELLPSPSDLPAVIGSHPKTGAEERRAPRANEPLCALAFKLQIDASEELCFVRVYSGSIAPGERLYNPRTGHKLRVSRVLQMHADHRRPVERAGPGDVVALTGLKGVATGDTLCDPKRPISLGGLEFAEPVITCVVEPESSDGRERLRAGLARVAAEDPTLRIREDQETGQWLLEGMGELHLEVVQHRLESDLGLEVRVGEPRVAYRERVRKPGRGEAAVDKVLGGKEVYGRLELELRRGEGAGRFELLWAPKCQIPDSFRAAIEATLEAASDTGPRFGFPLDRAEITILSGNPAPGRESELGYTQAAAQALRAAMAAAEFDLLEPVVDLVIQAPASFMSGLIADLGARRVEVGDLVVEGERRTLMGRGPLAALFGYSTVVRSLSQGRASFSMTPAGFEVVPDSELAERGLEWT